jgi:scyllo-inositol 2-dehydrogenase (NADP+)
MNKQIVTALASFGMSGKVFHAPLLSVHPGFKLKTVVERNKFEAKSIYPDIQVAQSFSDLLNDDEIELIIVNTPDNTHAEFANKALKAGKHVVVEKPFTQQTSQGEALLNEARYRGKTLTVFQNRRWDGDFLTVQKIISQGVLGKVVEYEARFDRYRNSIQQGSWKESASSGSGTLYNLGSHLIDQALVLFGFPEGVYANIHKRRAGSEIDDFFSVQLMYPDKSVTVKASYLAKQPGPRFLIHGTHGSFIKFGLDPQEDALKNGVLPGTEGWGRESEELWGTLNFEKDGQKYNDKIETLPGNYPAFYDNLYDNIIHQKAIAVRPQEAIRVIEVIEAAAESAEDGKIIEF